MQMQTLQVSKRKIWQILLNVKFFILSKWIN